ncbi:unnamed protein product [Cylicocyclus nassatus]|uniref:C-type lectin domain-containing protein n=1 Tax=Cylicocyclus nassatus TaxID=53992 RepID=A0AA36GL52_CYLNA|nr:unnamed protein product [Cylicocyclus nassatus]
MSSIMFWFFVWITLASTSINPSSNELISKSLDQFPGFSSLKDSHEACPGHCESGWTHFDKNDACYKTFYNANAYDAEYICNTLGGHLTSIHSSDENMFVAELAKMGKPYSEYRDLTWIGLWKEGKSGNWTWTDGTKVDYLRWATGALDSGYPCAMLYSDPHVDLRESILYQQWDDYHCAATLRAFVCKKTALY